MTFKIALVGAATGIAALLGLAGTAQAYPHGSNNHRGDQPYYGQTYGQPGGQYGQHSHGNQHGGRQGYNAYNNAAVILFEHSEFRGQALGVNGDLARLNDARFNDRASSIVVNSGVWEVCTDAYFRGRCTVIDGTLARTNQIRLNDNISSIRRVGGYGNGHRKGQAAYNGSYAPYHPQGHR